MSAEEQTGKWESRGNLFSHYCVFTVQRSHLSSDYRDASSGHQVLSRPLKRIRDEIVRSPCGHFGLFMEFY